MQRRYKRDAVSISNSILNCALELPVDVVDEDQDARADRLALDEHVVALAHKVHAHPLNEVTERRHGFRDFDRDVLAVVEEVL